ncbi:tocopherol cyclase family protein [Actinomyces sp.]|uniref:tocopherol cyclase family protein n=1 Tax=Actinomyces sp. TaxID=29317 RepID=UPI0028993D68|nr:tocopherol cyclase family protein [Actinomyces sp.]
MQAGGPRRRVTAYRASGADLPFGHPEWSHGVAMEGYFWRLTDPTSGRVAIALIGVQNDDTGSWALTGLGTSEGSWRQAILPAARARRTGLGARAGDLMPSASPDTAGNRGGVTAGEREMETSGGATGYFLGTDRRLLVELGDDAKLDVHLEATDRWPSRRPFGGSSWFQAVPGLNQYWHPWLLGGRATGSLDISGERWEFVDAEVYGEKNWGRAGFPDSWWWGQAQGFPDTDACVAFAGGEVTAGRLRTEVTGLVVRLPDGHVIRLGNPVTSPVRADVGDEHWILEGRSLTWSVSVEARAPLGDALVLPVPLVGQRRAVPGAIEQLAGTLAVRVRHRGHLVWEAKSSLAGLEHGGLARAAALAASRA